jgi:electron transfer flavoprotein alpha subunit
MDRSTVIVAEHQGGKIDPITYELASCAMEIQRYRPTTLKYVILGDKVEDLAEELANNTGKDIIGIQDPNLVSYNAEAYKTLLGDLLQDLRATYVCIAHTTKGLDYAPALAMRLQGGCITGVEHISQEELRICFSRAIYNGKILANVIPETEPTVLTIQPGAFKAPNLDNSIAGSVEIRKTTFETQQSRRLGVKQTKESDSALAEAEVIVAAGRGIGKKGKLELIYRLAAIFPKSAVGGSRPMCDMGWMEYKRQVGLTGATVMPKLYLACGISGSSQHIAGMRASGFIAAINTDPNAAIFNVADVCVVEDLTRFIPVLIEEYEKQ